MLKQVLIFIALIAMLQVKASVMVPPATNSVFILTAQKGDKKKTFKVGESLRIKLKDGQAVKGFLRRVDEGRIALIPFKKDQPVKEIDVQNIESITKLSRKLRKKLAIRSIAMLAIVGMGALLSKVNNAISIVGIILLLIPGLIGIAIIGAIFLGSFLLQAIKKVSIKKGWIISTE